MTSQNKLTTLQDCIIRAGSEKNYPLYDAAKLMTLREAQNTERSEFSCIDREIVEQWGFEDIESDEQLKRSRTKGVVQENERFPHYLICPDYTILQVHATDVKKMRADLLFFLQTQFKKPTFRIRKENVSSAEEIIKNLVPGHDQVVVCHKLSENVRSILYLNHYDEKIKEGRYYQDHEKYCKKYGQAARHVLRNPIRTHFQIYFGWGIGDDHSPIVGASFDAALSCMHYFWQKEHFTTMYFNPHSGSDTVYLLHDKTISKELKDERP